MRFNPPPNWPSHPQGWTPPEDWRPDTAWGPPPPGWQLWVDDSVRPRSRRNLVVLVTLGLVVLAVAIFLVLG